MEERCGTAITHVEGQWMMHVGMEEQYVGTRIARVHALGCDWSDVSRVGLAWEMLMLDSTLGRTRRCHLTSTL